MNAPTWNAVTVSCKLRAEDARRAQVILMLTQDASFNTITATVGCYPALSSAGTALHFTPTYASWPNRVALWFAEIQRDLLASDIFTSLHDLGAMKIRRYIIHYIEDQTPILDLTATRDTAEEMCEERSAVRLHLAMMQSDRALA